MEERCKRPRVLLVAALFATLAVISTWPLATDPAHNDLASRANNDVRFNTYVVFWGAHALTTDPLNLHHTNMFHPERNTFAYSDIELSSSLLMLPAIAIWYNPVLTYNLLVLSAIVLGGVGFYLLAFDLTRHRGAALIGAAVFVFNPAHFGRYLQIQFFADQWLPWSAWALLRWLRGKPGGEWGRWPWAIGAGLFYCLHALTGSHNTVFGAVFFGIAILWFTFANGLWRQWRFWGGLGLMATIAAIVLLPVFLPYFEVERELSDQRVADMNTLRAGAGGPYELLSSGSRLHRWIDDTLGWPSSMFDGRLRGYLFPGFIAVALGLLGIFLSGKPKEGRAQIDSQKLAAWTLDVVALAAALAAVSQAMTGSESLFILFVIFIPLPAPPAWILAAAAIAAVALRLATFARYTHALSALAGLCIEKLRSAGDKGLWLFVVVFGLVAALGPDAGLYQIIGRVPLLRLIRVPRRFILLMTFALAALAAYGFAVLLKRLPKRGARLAVVVLLIVLFSAESLFIPLKVYPFDPEPLPVYRWLDDQEGDFTVVEFPLNPDLYALSMRQVYASIYHWKRLVTGYSGFQSEENKALQRRLNDNFPNDEGLAELRELGVRFILVIEERLPAVKRETLHAQTGLAFEKSFGGISVYRLKPAVNE